jgi:hypothetical protein
VRAGKISFLGKQTERGEKKAQDKDSFHPHGNRPRRDLPEDKSMKSRGRRKVNR